MLADRYLSCLSVTLVYSGRTVRWIKNKLGMGVGLGPGHIVLDGDPAPPPKGGHSSPHFSAHVYCGQTAGWIKMPLGTEVGDIMLDGARPRRHCVRYEPSSHLKGAQPPITGPCLLWPDGRPYQLLLSTCYIGIVGLPLYILNSSIKTTMQAYWFMRDITEDTRNY